VSDIPLHLQRRFEQRWAARLAPTEPSAVSAKLWPEKHGQPIAMLGKGKRRPAGVNRGPIVANLDPAPAAQASK